MKKTILTSIFLSLLSIFCINIFAQNPSKHYDKGLKLYAANEYSKATKEFEAAFKATNDFQSLYFAGLSAYANQDFVKSAELLSNCVDAYYYADGDVFLKLSECYIKNGDTINAKITIENAFRNYPLNQDIIISLTNLYNTNKFSKDELFSLLEEVGHNYPDSAPICYVEGNIYEEFGDCEKAIMAYEKANKIDSTYVFGFIGLGIMHYKQAVEIQSKASNEKDILRYNALVEDFESTLQKAISPFEKAFAISNDNNIKLSIAEYLKNIYSVFKEQNEQYMMRYEQYSKIVANGHI